MVKIDIVDEANQKLPTLLSDAERGHILAHKYLNP